MGGRTKQRNLLDTRTRISFGKAFLSSDWEMLKTCLGMNRAAKCAVYFGLFELNLKYSWAVERGEVKVAILAR